MYFTWLPQDVPGAEEAIDALTEQQMEEFKEAFALFDKVRSP